MRSAGIQYRIIARVMDGNKVTGYHLESSKGEKLVCTKDALAFLVAKGSVINCKGQFYKGKVVLSGLGIKIEDLPVVKDTSVKTVRSADIKGEKKDRVKMIHAIAKDKSEKIRKAFDIMHNKYKLADYVIADIKTISKAIDKMVRTKLKFREDEFRIEDNDRGETVWLYWDNGLLSVGIECGVERGDDYNRKKEYKVCLYSERLDYVWSDSKGYRYFDVEGVINAVEKEIAKAANMISVYSENYHNTVIKNINHTMFGLLEQVDTSRWKGDTGELVYKTDIAFGRYILTWKNSNTGKIGKIEGMRIYEDYDKVIKTIEDEVLKDLS